MSAEPRPANRWRAPVLIFLSVVLLIALSIRVYYVHAAKRYAVTGSTLDDCGYTIKYTVSTQYPKSKGTGMLQPDASFTQAPPPKWLIWMREHVQRMSHQASTAPGPMIGQFAERPANGMLRIEPDGYPELRSLLGSLVDHRHLIVSGYPATWVTMDSPGATPGSHILITGFAVHPPSSSVNFVFYSLCEGDRDRVEASRELMAILDSVEIDKR